MASTSDGLQPYMFKINRQRHGSDLLGNPFGLHGTPGRPRQPAGHSFAPGDGVSMCVDCYVLDEENTAACV